MDFLCSWTQKKETKQRRLWVLALLLLLQPLMALFSAPLAMAQAGTPGAVIINEFSASGSADWVELYNTTSTAVTVTNWVVTDDAAMYTTTLSGVIAAQSFMVVEMNNTLAETGTIRLNDDMQGSIDTVAYSPGGAIPYPVANKSAARIQDGGAQWGVGPPTKGVTNAIPDTLPPSTPSEGAPHSSLQPGQFTFTWQPSLDTQSSVRYAMRLSQDQSQVGLQESSTALLFSDIPVASLPAPGMLTDGLWYWQVQAQDTANNKSAWSEVWSVEVDKTLPSVTITQPVNGLFGGPQSMQVPFEATITDSHYASVRVLLDGNDAEGLVVNSVAAGVRVSGMYSAKSFYDGPHSIKVIAVDGVGNIAETLRTFEIDTTPPGLTTSIEDNEIIKGMVTIDLHAIDARLKASSVDILNSRGASVKQEMLANESVVDGEEIQSNPASITYKWDTASIADGMYTIRYSGVDEAGNETVMYRRVIVDNIIDTGFGGVTTIDPLLEELSATLSQPFAVPQSFVIPQQRIVASTASQDRDTAIASEDGKISDIDVPAIAVAATGSGWRILGILWYWWALVIILIALVVYRSWQTVKSYRVVVE